MEGDVLGCGDLNKLVSVEGILWFEDFLSSACEIVAVCKRLVVEGLAELSAVGEARPVEGAFRSVAAALCAVGVDLAVVEHLRLADIHLGALRTGYSQHVVACKVLPDVEDEGLAFFNLDRFAHIDRVFHNLALGQIGGAALFFGEVNLAVFKRVLRNWIDFFVFHMNRRFAARDEVSDFAGRVKGGDAVPGRIVKRRGVPAVDNRRFARIVDNAVEIVVVDQRAVVK